MPRTKGGVTHARNMREMMGLRGTHPGKIQHERQRREAAAAKEAEQK